MNIHSIELTNHCNLSCKYCPNGGEINYPKGYMTAEHFFKALEHAIYGVGLSGCGESFLHPQLCAFIRLAVEYGKDPGINTNGLLLTPDLCMDLVKAGLTHMEISIHNEKCYKKYKMIKDLQVPIHITANVLTVNAEKALEWRGRDTYPLKIQSTHSWALGTPHTPDKCVFISREWCTMKWDGKIAACCFDFGGDAIIGHIDKFEDIKHQASYELCKTCSPSWTTGKNDMYWLC